MKLSTYNYKNQLISCLLFLFASVATINTAWATHYAGGNIYYKCLGNNQYEITLEVRRDCINGAASAPFDDPASIGIFNGNGQLTTLGPNGFGQLLIDFTGQDTLTEVLTSECRVLGSEVCVERTIYKDIITLPYEPLGYIFVYQRCCRSIDLLNVLDPTFTGTTEWIFLSDKAQLECNSSPVFNQWPTIYACSQLPLVFDHSAIDADGDSLVYKLCTPYTGASNAFPIPQPPGRPDYDLITWNTGYSEDNPLGSAVPLLIDPVTGILTGEPNLTGQYLVGVCVEEYRDGILLSTVRRNFEYNIRVCVNNPVADFIVPENPNCESLTQTFENISTPGNYTWYFDYPSNSISSNEVNPTFTFPTSGLFPVQLIVTDQDCVDSIVINVGVSLPDDPTASFAVSSVNCSDDVVLDFVNTTTTSQAQTAHYWEFAYDDVILTSEMENPTMTIPSGVDLEVSFTVTTISGCTNTYIEVVSVESSVLTLIGSQIEVCEMTQFELVLNASDNLTFTWSPTTNLDLTDPANPIVTTQNDITYSVTATNGVCTLTDQISLIVAEEQNINVLAPQQICGTDLTMQAISFNGATFEWFSDEALTNSLGTNNPITVSPPLGQTTYYVALSGDICSGMSSFTVTNEPLDFEITPDVNFANCAGDSIMVSIENLSTTQNLTFNWDSPFVVEGQNNSNATLLFNQAGQYTVPVSIANQFGCLQDTFVNVSVIERPFFDNTPLFVCINESIGLNENGNTGWIYTWSTTDMTLLPDPNAANPIVSGLTSTTTFNVTISDNIAGLCPSQYAIVVEVSELINLEAPSIVNYCKEDGFSLTVTTDIMSSITFLNSDGEVAFIGNTITDASIGDGEYTIVAEDINGCTESQMIVIAAYDAINAVFPEDIFYCIDESPIITIAADTDIEVQLLNENGEVVYNGNDIPVADFPDGTYTIVATDINSCSESSSIVFTTYDAINLQAPTEILYCPGEEVFITITADIDVTIKITDVDGNVVAEGGEVLVSDLTPGLYTIMATSSDGCIEMQELNVFSPSNINLVLSTDTPKYCTGNPVILTATADTDVVFEWIDSNGTIVGTTAEITVNPMGMQTYTVTATDPSGCADVAEITIMEYILDVAIEAPELLCENQEGIITITNLDADQMLVYNWSPGSQIVSGGNSSEVTVLLTETTTFEVLITNMDGCQWVESVSIALSAFEPSVVATAVPMDILLGQTTQLEVNQNPDFDYQWSNGETLDQDNIYNPVATPEDELSTYSVTVTNDDGCTAVASVNINVTLPNCDESDIFVPNLFSPNNDNLNDTWRVESNYIDNIEIIVYNRWGEKVFESTSQFPGWDGTFENELLKPDVYGYWMTIECINGFTYTTQGNVTLIR